jgi:hypothetical protein
MGIHFRLTDIVPNIDRLLYGLTVGFMMNTSRRTALGAEAFGGIEGLLRGGVALRWRRWLGSRSSLDLALRVHLFGTRAAGASRTVRRCSGLGSTPATWWPRPRAWTCCG